MLIASYYFYMCWNAKHALLLLTSTIVTYASGLLIEKIKYMGKKPEKAVRLKKCGNGKLLGISFYTFQALSYTMDVYFLFSQLVAGPIERSKNLLKQLAVPKKF